MAESTLERTFTERELQQYDGTPRPACLHCL